MRVKPRIPRRGRGGDTSRPSGDDAGRGAGRGRRTGWGLREKASRCSPRAPPRRCRCALVDALLVRPDHEILTLIEPARRLIDARTEVLDDIVGCRFRTPSSRSSASTVVKRSTRCWSRSSDQARLGVRSPSEPDAGDHPVERRLSQRRAHRCRRATEASGPRRSRCASAQMEIPTSVLDLVTHYPRRYADRTNAVAIGALRRGRRGGRSSPRGIRRADMRRPRGSAARSSSCVLEDETGRPSMSASSISRGALRQLPADMHRRRLRQSRRVPGDPADGELPIVDLVGDRTGRIVPIYPQSEQRRGIGSERALRIHRRGPRTGEASSPTRLPEAASNRAALGLARPDRRRSAPSMRLTASPQEKGARGARPRVRRALPPAARAGAEEASHRRGRVARCIAHQVVDRGPDRGRTSSPRFRR